MEESSRANNVNTKSWYAVCGIDTSKMNDEMEKLINGCKSLEDIREKAKTNNQLEKELIRSMEPTQDLLSSIFTRQDLKNEPFKMFEPVTKAEMEIFGVCTFSR